MPLYQGEFEVRPTPEPAADLGDGVSLMHMRFDKTFTGPLAAQSVVQMLGVMDAAVGSGGYVAIERVVGALDGRDGTFLLQHSSTLARGAQAQSITVIPDSGTGALAGLEGRMTITITGGRHHYTFDCTFADAG
jgi:hypothetical protein